MSPTVARTLAALERFDKAYGNANPNRGLSTWIACPWKPPQKQLAVFDERAQKWVIIPRK